MAQLHLLSILVAIIKNFSKRDLPANLFSIEGDKVLTKLKKDLYDIRYSLIILTIYCIIMQIIFGTVCPLKALTGIPCPACGLTHATIYLFTGNIKKALSYNPTVLIWVFVILLFLFDRYIYKLKINIFPFFFIAASLITITWYLIKILY